MKLRIARATNDLTAISTMYERGLNFKRLASFDAHAGFSGVILGDPGESYHLEFTQENQVVAPRCHSPEDLLVFYLPNNAARTAREEKLVMAGFILVPAHNPYWEVHGATFEDFEGYRIVICKQEWTL